MENMYVAINKKTLSDPVYAESLEYLFSLEETLEALHEFEWIEWWIDDDVPMKIVHQDDIEEYKEDEERITHEEWLKLYGKEIANKHKDKVSITRKAKLVIENPFTGFEKEKTTAKEWLSLVDEKEQRTQTN